MSSVSLWMLCLAYAWAVWLVSDVLSFSSRSLCTCVVRSRLQYMTWSVHRVLGPLRPALAHHEYDACPNTTLPPW